MQGGTFFDIRFFDIGGDVNVHGRIYIVSGGRGTCYGQFGSVLLIRD